MECPSCLLPAISLLSEFKVRPRELVSYLIVSLSGRCWVVRKVGLLCSVFPCLSPHSLEGIQYLLVALTFQSLPVQDLCFLTTEWSKPSLWWRDHCSESHFRNFLSKEWGVSLFKIWLTCYGVSFILAFFILWGLISLWRLDVRTNIGDQGG